jgi:predicted dehydrogenase
MLDETTWVILPAATNHQARAAQEAHQRQFAWLRPGRGGAVPARPWLTSQVPAAGTLSEALEHDGVDLVVNLTLPSAHAEVAAAAIGAGKHVWNEKPLTTDPASGRALLQHSGKHVLCEKPLANTLAEAEASCCGSRWQHRPVTGYEAGSLGR